MARYFAQLDANQTVIRVIVAESDFVGLKTGTWVETSKDGTKSKNFAGIGHVYDSTRNAFLFAKPFPSWKLNESTLQWDPPVARPPIDNIPRIWDEASQSWKVLIVPAPKEVGKG